MMTEIERYSLRFNGGRPDLFATGDGEWVRYDDVVSFLQNTLPRAFCWVQDSSTGAVCELPKGHTENHRGPFDHGMAQWPQSALPNTEKVESLREDIATLQNKSRSELDLLRGSALPQQETTDEKTLAKFRRLLVVLDQQLKWVKDGNTSAHSADYWVGAKQVTEAILSALSLSEDDPQTKKQCCCKAPLFGPRPDGTPECRMCGCPLPQTETCGHE